MHSSCKNAVLGIAVEYIIPAVWVVWSHDAKAPVRGLQRGYLEGRAWAADVQHPETGAADNPDFAAMALSCGVQGALIGRPEDLGGAIKPAIAANKPFPIDANIRAGKTRAVRACGPCPAWGD